MGGKFIMAFIAGVVYFTIRPAIARTTGLPV
jgi:hypothetical protein